MPILENRDACVLSYINRICIKIKYYDCQYYTIGIIKMEPKYITNWDMYANFNQRNEIKFCLQRHATKLNVHTRLTR